MLCDNVALKVWLDLGNKNHLVSFPATNMPGKYPDVLQKSLVFVGCKLVSNRGPSLGIHVITTTPFLMRTFDQGLCLQNWQTMEQSDG